MTGPYRDPDPTPDELPEPERHDGLGRLRSSHGRGVTGAVAIALGRRSAVDVHENGLAIWDTLARRCEVAFGEIDAILGVEAPACVSTST